jgi:Tfp pilus assembly protein PilF
MNNNMGLVLKSLGRSAEALEHFRVAVSAPAADELPEAQANLAIMQKDLGALEAEISRLAQALARDPANIEARYALGVALAVNGQRKLAAQQAQQLVQAKPRDAYLLYRVAFLLRANGQNATAAQVYELAAKHARAQGLAKLSYAINRETAELAASGTAD